MNGIGSRRSFDMEPAPLAPFRDVRPSGQAMVNGYRDELMDGVEAQPRFHPINTRPPSSALVDLQDPIQVHLLTETALADSHKWEILSQEEVDGLKKQCRLLQERIEQTRANLAIQSKYRDAAISMSKLYASSRRRSLLGNRGSGSEAGREAEAEREACERRCEELATELFALEKRIMQPERRLLQHTAGILQLTHKASARRQGTPAMPTSNGIPGSPESLYTYSNGRGSMEMTSSPDGLPDEPGLYLPIDMEPQAKTRAVEIPQKSPIRKETKELRDETARLQGEIAQLRASNDSLELELDTQQAVMAEAEEQMEDLGRQLRDVVVRFDPENNNGYDMPPAGGGGGGGVDAFMGQLRYFDATIKAVQAEQEASLSSTAKQADTEAMLARIQERMAATNSEIGQILSGSGSQPPPLPAMGGVNEQLNWLQGILPTLQQEAARASDVSGSYQTERQSAEQVNTVLSGLWEIMQSGLVEGQRKREERKAARAQRGLTVEDDDEASGDESAMGTDEPYSLEGFSGQVQWLYEQTTKLREHKSVLKRQIKQQRELNNKSDAEKDEELRSKSEELEEAHRAAEAAQEQLARALEELSETQGELMQRSTVAAAASGAQEQLAEREGRVTALETRGIELQQALAAAQADVAGLATQLQEAAAAEKSAREAAETAQQQVAAAQAQVEATRQQAAALKAEAHAQATTAAEQAAQQAEAAAWTAAEKAHSKDEELERLNAMLVELKTEATIAKAELEGAYGSRAQRAADVAALAKSSENRTLQEQLESVRAELASTLQEYEELTRDAVSGERVRAELEGQLDDAVAARTALESEANALRARAEAEVNALKEELDAERLRVVGPASANTSGTRAGASMLSEQFRATMREERKKFQEELRNEQAQRRRLEEEMRALKRAAGPGKSPLSPR